MTPLERAYRAKELMGDAVMQQAFADIRMALVAQMEQSAIGDLDTHHEIALTLQLLKQLRERLDRYAQELAIDQQKQKHESFIAKMRERIA
jgi:hypothetical protein